MPFPNWRKCNLLLLLLLLCSFPSRVAPFHRRGISWFLTELHSHAYTCVTVCSFVSFTYYLIYLRRQIAKKIRLWRCLLHLSFPSHSW
jgi:hypothetical protein